MNDTFTILDVYTDDLISSFSQTSATGLSRLVDEAVSHDQVTRFLCSGPFGSKELRYRYVLNDTW